MAGIIARPTRTTTARLQGAVTIAAGALLPIALVIAILTFPERPWIYLSGAFAVRIGLAALLYLISQVLRGLRIAFILTDIRVSLRRLMEVHFLTEAVGMVIPYKIGELYRVFEIGVLCDHFPRAVIAVWIERAADSMVIGIIIIVALTLGPGGYEAVLPLLALLAIFITLSLLVFLVIPQNISRLKHFVIRRYHSEAAVNFLRCVDLVQRTLSEAPLLMQQKYMTLLFLTACVWIAESLVLCAIIPGLVRNPAFLATGLVNFLTTVSTGLSAVGPLPTEAFGHIATIGSLSGVANAGMYRLATAVPLLLVGIVAFVRYGCYRLRQTRKPRASGQPTSPRRSM